jgi:hypothetical protein
MSKMEKCQSLLAFAGQVARHMMRMLPAGRVRAGPIEWKPTSRVPSNGGASLVARAEGARSTGAVSWEKISQSSVFQTCHRIERKLPRLQ